MKFVCQKMLFAFMCFHFISCGSDPETTPTYEFKDQNLQGMIEGETWEFRSGSADIWGTNAANFFVDLSAINFTDPCTEFSFGGDRIFFSIPKEVGVHPLSIDYNTTGSGQTATLFSAATQVNTIATQGAIEFLTITADEVTGRMDIRFDATSFANGNFTIPVCQ